MVRAEPSGGNGVHLRELALSSLASRLWSRGPLHNKSRSLKSPLTAVNGVLRCIIKPRPLFVANIPVNYGFFYGPQKRPRYLFAAWKMARFLLLGERSQRVFEKRVDPLVKFDTEKFRSRYRLSKEAVLDLAEDFGRSRFASKGKGRGGGLSNQLKVRVPVIYCVV